MSTVSAGETCPPTTEGLIIPTSSMDYNDLEQEKQQQSSIISANMLPSLPASTSSCCQPTTMSNSSSRIDLFVETPSTTMDTSITMCGSSPTMYGNAGVLDLCGSGLEKLHRAAPLDVLNTTTLLLDDNCLQRLDNIHTYQCLEKLSAENNRLIRMLQIAKLHHLKILNLPNNCLSTIEGLKDLKLLTWLGLSGNRICQIESLSQNIHLEHLDLSDNKITSISDISYLKNLKALLVHKNLINTLMSCERFLPSTSLNTLTLNDNHLEDLAQLTHLSKLSCIEQLTIANNPAVEQPENERRQYDYRPYVINWCLCLRVLDGILIGAKESLKAEWMYSQSKGRAFGVGQHKLLVDYLVQVCPLHPDDDWQEDKKLNLILSKVQEHQSSLRTSSDACSTGLSPRVQSNGSNTLPRSSTPLQITESPVKHGPTIPHVPQNISVSVPGGGGSRRNSNTGASQNVIGNTVDASTPSSTPSIPRRSSVGVDGSAKINGRGSYGNPSVPRRNSYSRTSPSPVRRSVGRTMTLIGTSRYAMEPKAYNLSLPRSLYGDDINGNSHSDPMTQSCYVQLGSSDMMSSSMHGGTGGMMMSNSMIMTNNGASVGPRENGRSRATAWNEYSNNSEGESKSLIPERHIGPPITQHDLMTTSLDPVMLIQQTTEATGSGSTPTPVPGLVCQESWATSGTHRPNTLFEYDANNGGSTKPENSQQCSEVQPQSTTTIPSSVTSESMINQQIKDIYLQDLSDSELSQSLMYSRLQNRLNPVPESLNSPDIPPPTSNDGMTRPPRDDPLRVYNRDYNRDIRIAVQKQNLNMKPEKLSSTNQLLNGNRSKGIALSLSRHINDVISSSTEDDDDNRQNRSRENQNMITNKNAANIRKGSLSSNIKTVVPDNQQMSPLVSQTKSISKHSASHNLNARNVSSNQRPTSACQVGLDNSTHHGLSKLSGTNSLTNSPRSSSLSHKKKPGGIVRTSSVNYTSSPAKNRLEYKSNSKTPEKSVSRDFGEGSKNKINSDTKISNYIPSERNVVDDSCSGRSSRCDETEDGEDPSSAETEGISVTNSVDLSNRRNYRRIHNRKPRSSRKKSSQSPDNLNNSNRNSSSTRSNIFSLNANGTKVTNPAASNMDQIKQISTPSRKPNRKISSAESASSKYAPEKYASDGSRSESVNMSPRTNNLASSKRTTSTMGNLTNIYKRPSSSKPSYSQKSNTISASSTTGSPRNRPMSAVTAQSAYDKRPRANTLTTPVMSDKSLRNSASNTEIASYKRPQQKAKGNKTNGSTTDSQVAATVIQTQWRGHATRNNDPKVIELKEEVRNLRTEQHIRHLTKELSAAKSALEQERKLRALQMDAIKVLWKEVQLLDAHKNENSSVGIGNGGLNSIANNRARPSGSSGSKISSRSSEHSIAKLMETLELTAGTGCGFKNGTTPTASGIPGSSSTFSLSTAATNNMTGTMTTPSSSDSPIPRNQYIMAQSMPASVLMNQLEANAVATHEQQPPQALDTLNKTCSSLQNQVEQLQSSLTGVMQFMSAFSSLEVSEMAGTKTRTRHSSSTSTQETISFPYNNNSIMSASMINPITTSAQPHSFNKTGISNVNTSDEVKDASVKAHHPFLQENVQSSLKMQLGQDSDGSECLSISINPSETNQGILERSVCAMSHDSIGISSCAVGETTPVNKNTPDKIDIKHTETRIEGKESSEINLDGSLQSVIVLNNGHLKKSKEIDSHRPKSPRPKTLPGLNKNGKEKSIPGLAQLAGNALLNSPQAPQQVKAFAKTLVEGLITDSITAKEGNEDCNEATDNLKNESQPNSELGDECGVTGCDDMTDASLSLATETEGHNIETDYHDKMRAPDDVA